MAFDWTMGIPTLFIIASAVCGGIYAWVTVTTKITSLEKTRETDALAMTALRLQDQMLQDRLDAATQKHNHELSEFKLEVVKNYATNTAIREVEERIVVAIDRLGDRLDKIIDGQSKAVIRARRGETS